MLFLAAGAGPLTWDASHARTDGSDVLFVSPAPDIAPDQARSIAATKFGIEASARALTSERDRNFHLRSDDGLDFVLKITNAAEEPLVNHMQTAAILHIEGTAPSLPIPRVCRTLEGDIATEIRDGDLRHTVRLFTYLDGEPLYKIDPSEELVAELGRSLALLGLALHDFDHPAASRDLLWDLRQANGLRRFLDHVDDRDLRTTASTVLDRYERVGAPLQAKFRTQILHNDFNPHNILIDPSGGGRISGILDFGDMVHTALVNDLAVALSYQVEGEYWLKRTRIFLAAFHAVRPLFRTEVEHLFDLVMLRQVMTIAITSWRASLYPDNAPYILRNRPRAISALNSLAAMGCDKGTEYFLEACGMAK